MLANVYLHNVFDLRGDAWLQKWAQGAKERSLLKTYQASIASLQARRPLGDGSVTKG